MFQVEKTRNLINKRMAFFCGLFVAAVLALLPISAGAQCKSWEAGREMLIMQPGFQSKLTIEQNGAVITGKALGIVREKDGSRMLTAQGNVDGTFDGNNFSIQIYWYNDHTGVYNGKVRPSGRLDGEAYEKRSPNVRLPWHTDEALKCAPPPPVIPKVIKSSGRKPAAKPEPPKPPFIIAGQPIITPNPIASVYLGWDGGPDHPKVEVWLSIDNGVEIPAFSIEFVQGHPVFKQPKASVSIALNKGRHYKFVLKDGDKTLSSASFVIPLF